MKPHADTTKGNKTLNVTLIRTSNLKVATPVDKMMHRQVAHYKSINLLEPEFYI